jgi:hypothetical protein
MYSDFVLIRHLVNSPLFEVRTDILLCKTFLIIRHFLAIPSSGELTGSHCNMFTLIITRYKIKVWSIVFENGFFVDGHIYLRRQSGDEPESKQNFNVVTKLCNHFQGSGRNNIADNFYTSASLPIYLLANGLNCLETLRKKPKSNLPAAFERPIRMY